MTTSRYSLSLRIRHPSMNCGDIAAKVGKTLKFIQNVGEGRKTPKGDPLSGVYTETYCSFPVAQGEFSAIEQELRSLTASPLTAEGTLKDIIDTGGRMEYFIGCFIDKNNGMTLNECLLSDLAALKISVAFDLYGQDD